MPLPVIFGATGGHCTEEAAQKIDLIVAAVIEELAVLAGQPVCLAGDRHAGLGDSPMLSDLVQHEGLVGIEPQA